MILKCGTSKTLLFPVYYSARITKTRELHIPLIWYAEIYHLFLLTIYFLIIFLLTNEILVMDREA